MSQSIERRVLNLRASLSAEHTLLKRLRYRFKNQHKSSVAFARLNEGIKWSAAILAVIPDSLLDKDASSDQVADALRELTKAFLVQEKSLPVLDACAAVLNQHILSRSFLPFFLTIFSIIARLKIIVLGSLLETCKYADVLLLKLSADQVQQLTEKAKRTMPREQRPYLQLSTISSLRASTQAALAAAQEQQSPEAEATLVPAASSLGNSLAPSEAESTPEPTQQLSREDKKRKFQAAQEERAKKLAKTEARPVAVKMTAATEEDEGDWTVVAPAAAKVAPGKPPALVPREVAAAPKVASSSASKTAHRLPEKRRDGDGARKKAKKDKDAAGKSAGESTAGSSAAGQTADKERRKKKKSSSKGDELDDIFG